MFAPSLGILQTWAAGGGLEGGGRFGLCWVLSLVFAPGQWRLPLKTDEIRTISDIAKAIKCSPATEEAGGGEIWPGVCHVFSRGKTLYARTRFTSMF